MKKFLIKLQRKIWRIRYSKSLNKVLRTHNEKAIAKHIKINNELNRLIDLENSLK